MGNVEQSMAEYSEAVSGHLENPPIRLSFYHGAYGPTLRLCLQSEIHLERLRNVFREFAGGEVTEVELGSLLPVEYDGLRSIFLRSDISSKDHSKRLVMVSSTELPTFTWSQTPTDWDSCVGLLEGFSDTPGHHYLSEEGIDDALIEVAFLVNCALG